MSQQKVLCIEDDKALARLVQIRLEKHGYAVDTATNGKDGLAMVESAAYEAVTVDYKMPGMDGLEVLRALVKMEPTPPCIMVSGAGDLNVALEAIHLGAADYMIKETGTVFFDLLANTIETILERKRLIQAKAEAEEALQKANDELEIRVEERTRELTEEVAERKRAEKKAETANRAKSAFLSSMSHELMTPLNAILGFGQLLESNSKEQLSESQVEWIDKILNGGQELYDLIRKILSFSEITDGEADFVPRDVDAMGMVGDGLVATRTDADNQGIKLILDIPDGELPKIRIDPIRGNEILLIFLSNAVLYNQPGGEIRVGVSLENEDWIRISVSDTGQGIPNEKHDKVFLPFQRLGESNTAISGAGIGLAIAKGLTELMNGCVGFESEEGKGSTFWMEFPAVHME
ncbi:MAG: hybrid sensor histidine kinase/response regulator [Rhodospirillales bacterium]|jgi:signal transduction histidine kinase|nr:hybrid sensor histidine kinase/response regulator [Rhodospirillales bacterium]